MIIILLRLYPYTVTKVVISHNNRNSEIINDRMVVWLDLPLDRTDCHRMLKLAVKIHINIRTPKFVVLKEYTAKQHRLSLD